MINIRNEKPKTVFTNVGMRPEVRDLNLLICFLIEKLGGEVSITKEEMQTLQFKKVTVQKEAEFTGNTIFRVLKAGE